MTDPSTKLTPEFQRGWDAALLAARYWHESQAKKALIQARRNRFAAREEGLTASQWLERVIRERVAAGPHREPERRRDEHHES
jgi:hypothetical protein